MLSPEEYLPLDNVITYLKGESVEVLKAIARAVKSVDPRTKLESGAIAGLRRGERIQGFSINYGQLSTYLDLAVDKYASVIIDTEVGVLESAHVSINREWLLDQIRRASNQPEVKQEIALRSYASKGATITPILPQLQDQTPELASAELRKYRERLARHLTVGPDDNRDNEIARLQDLLNKSNAEKIAVTEEKEALTKMVRTLTLENDQLRKARSQTIQPSAPLKPTTPSVKKPSPSNVEIYNEEARATRKAVAERARPLWLHEDFANHRTGDMVRTIRLLAESEPMGRLPESDEVLARWISEDAAPSFAKRPGRPRKEKTNK